MFLVNGNSKYILALDTTKGGEWILKDMTRKCWQSAEIFPNQPVDLSATRSSLFKKSAIPDIMLCREYQDSSIGFPVSN